MPLEKVERWIASDDNGGIVFLNKLVHDDNYCDGTQAPAPVRGEILLLLLLLDITFTLPL